MQIRHPRSFGDNHFAALETLAFPPLLDLAARLGFTLPCEGSQQSRNFEGFKNNMNKTRERGKEHQRYYPFNAYMCPQVECNTEI
jgi:hypothetical protein